MSAKDTPAKFHCLQFVCFSWAFELRDRGTSARVIMAQNCGHPESSHGTKRPAWLQQPNVHLEKMATVSKLGLKKRKGSLAKHGPVHAEVLYCF